MTYPTAYLLTSKHPSPPVHAIDPQRDRPFCRPLTGLVPVVDTEGEPVSWDRLPGNWRRCSSCVAVVTYRERRKQA